MSKLAEKLFEERETKEGLTADYAPLIRAVVGTEVACADVNNEQIAADVEEMMVSLNESHPLGGLLWYALEERMVYGKSKEELAKELAANADLLADDLMAVALRYFRHPKNSAALRTHLPKK